MSKKIKIISLLLSLILFIALTCCLFQFLNGFIFDDRNYSSVSFNSQNSAVNDELDLFVDSEEKLEVELVSVMHSSARIGQTIVFPQFIAKKIKGDNVSEFSEKRIVVNDTTTLVDDYSFTVPDCEQLKVEYQAKVNGSFVSFKTYNIKILPEDITTTSDLFLYSNEMQTYTLENGLIFSMNNTNDGYFISSPNVLSVNNFSFTFFVNEDKYGVNDFSVSFSDINGEDKLVLHFRNISTSTRHAVFTINNGVESFVLSGTSGIYSNQCGNTDAVDKFAQTSYVSFSLGLNCEQKYIFNNSDQKVITKFSQFENNKSFNGFTNDVFNFDAKISEVTKPTELGISRISNQQFSYLFEQMQVDKFDNQGPQISVFGGKNNFEVEKNSNLTICMAQGFDVIQGICSVRVTVRNPKNEKVINNLSASSVHTIKADLVGDYTIEYTSYDANNNKSTLIYRGCVPDRLKPELSVQGSYKTTYKLGDKLTVLLCDKQDDSSDVSLNVYLYNSDGISKISLGQEIELNKKGLYTIVYRGEDASKNVTRAVYDFMVD